LSDIFRWAYKPDVNFYFEVRSETDGDENPVYTFLTSEVPLRTAPPVFFFFCLLWRVPPPPHTHTRCGASSQREVWLICGRLSPGVPMHPTVS
jgi:hypothetical protein